MTLFICSKRGCRLSAETIIDGSAYCGNCKGKRERLVDTRCETCDCFGDPSSPWVNLCRLNPKPIRRNGSDWCGQWRSKP